MQTSLDNLILTGRGPRRRLALWLLRLRQRRRDPLVRYTLHGTTLLMPASHRLPALLRAFPHYSANLGRLVKAIQARYPALSMIDIGANIGDSVAMVRGAVHFPILCIEGDPVYFALLERNTAPLHDVSRANVYVSIARAQVAQESAREDGTAHLQPAKSGGGVQTVPLAEVLARWPSFAGAKLLKIDTDGFDGLIIRGAADVLTRLKPVVFFEYCPAFLTQQGDDGVTFFETLRACGYRRVLVWDNFGYFMQTLDLDDARRIAELREYFGARGLMFYADMAAFHEEDDRAGDSLLDSIQQAELAYFRSPAPGQ